MKSYKEGKSGFQNLRRKLVKKYPSPNGGQYCGVMKKFNGEFSSRRYWEYFKIKTKYHNIGGHVVERHFVYESKKF